MTDDLTAEPTPEIAAGLARLASKLRAHTDETLSTGEAWLRFAADIEASDAPTNDAIAEIVVPHTALAPASSSSSWRRRSPLLTLGAIAATIAVVIGAIAMLAGDDTPRRVTVGPAAPTAVEENGGTAASEAAQPVERFVVSNGDVRAPIPSAVVAQSPAHLATLAPDAVEELGAVDFDREVVVVVPLDAPASCISDTSAVLDPRPGLGAHTAPNLIVSFDARCVDGSESTGHALWLGVLGRVDVSSQFLLTIQARDPWRTVTSAWLYTDASSTGAGS